MDFSPILNKFTLKKVQSNLVGMIVEEKHPLAIAFCFNSTCCHRIFDEHFWQPLIVYPNIPLMINLIRYSRKN